MSDGKIAFSRLDSSFSRSIEVFDTLSATTTEIDPQTASSDRSNTAIGSNTVAFIDRGINVEGELLVSFIGGTTTRVTDDSRFDDHPAVAPLGDLVVYESCLPLGSCDIRQAAWNGATWLVTSLTANAEPEQNPDSDGSVAVYDAVRSGERDIFWQAVGGGMEHVLPLSGEQKNPSISGGTILFESAATTGGAADLWLYEIASNRLFQITSTPADESLNDISVQPDGSYRIVWSSGPVLFRDVYGATFELPPVGPSYTFGGFLAPVEPLPTLNSMKAGAAVPVRFSLGGDFGLDIFADGYPKSLTIDCDLTSPIDGIDETVTAGGSSLSYDAATDVYTYVWKTNKAWATTCRKLVLSFTDGTIAMANSKFK